MVTQESYLLESINDNGMVYRTFLRPYDEQRFLVTGTRTDGATLYRQSFECLTGATSYVLTKMGYKTFASITYPKGHRDGTSTSKPTIDLIHAKHLEDAADMSRAMNMQEFSSPNDFDGLHIVEVREQSTI